ncbi:hypothetical protein TNCV_3514211 [Trichonephila clavipes]|nr:hypothetical protein TNCV_3514211 [Trichonephila clavipes]
MAKGDFRDISLLGSDRIKNRECVAIVSMVVVVIRGPYHPWAEQHELERRRRIPFDFQRTSLAGLALDSEPVLASGELPALQCRIPSRHHLELQDRRDYTPADRAARTCWQKKPVVLHGRFLQDPTSQVQRCSEVQNSAPSASFPKEQSVVSSYQ